MSHFGSVVELSNNIECKGFVFVSLDNCWDVSLEPLVSVLLAVDELRNVVPKWQDSVISESHIVISSEFGFIITLFKVHVIDIKLGLIHIESLRGAAELRCC